MKYFPTVLGIVLFLTTGAAWAQNTAPLPDVLQMTPGTFLAQIPPEGPPPPGVVFQKRIVGGAGPDNVMFFRTGAMGPGEGMGAWWKNSETVAKLQLTEEQVRKISQTFLDHKLNLIDLGAEVEKQELRLQPLLDADHPDEAKVGAQIDAITTARGKLEKENAMMMLAIRSQLTIDQWKKLKALDATEEGKRKVFIYRGGPGVNVDAPPPLPPR